MSTSPGSTPPEPPSFEKRLPLALALMMLVLLGWQYIFKPEVKTKPAVPEATAPKAVEVKQPNGASPSAPAQPAAAPQANQVERTQAAAEQQIVVDTDYYHVVLSNKGGVVTNWVLKKYKDESGKSLELATNAADNTPKPFAIWFPAHKPDFDADTRQDDALQTKANTFLYQAQVSDNGYTVNFDFSDGRTAIHKSFEFKKDSYLTNVKSSVVQGNVNLPHLLTWRGGFGDGKVFKAFSKLRTVRYNPADAGFFLFDNSLKTHGAEEAKQGPLPDTGTFTFGGIEDDYFAAVALPPDNTVLDLRTFDDKGKVAGESDPQPFAGVGFGSPGGNSFSVFVGPKDTHLLEAINPKLDRLIDWGKFGFIAKPLFQSLNYVANHWTNHNYGWAIVLVTLIINIGLFPIRFSSLRSSRKMQKLQPELKAINEKYKNIKINDPRKAEQNQEVMDLYKKAGVNPVGGCLPLLLQLPFLYAFYSVLKLTIELRQAPWLWVTDLSNPETLAIHLLPIIMIVTQFLTQKMTPQAGVDPNQQKMFMFMPLMLGFFFYNLSSGLVLYYLTGNLVGIVFQLIVNRFMPAPPQTPPAAAKAPVRNTVKK